MQKTLAQNNFLKKIKASAQDPDQRKSLGNDIKKIALALLKAAILIGVSYVILSPVIGILVNSFSSNTDAVDPMVFVLPKNPTLERYSLAALRLQYLPTMARDLVYTLTLTLLQLLICSMVGYGFARFDFPFKKLLFGCVVVMIIIPSHTIMLPLYLSFRELNP